MVSTFKASMEAWSSKAKRNALLVAKDAIQQTLSDMSERQPSIKETGTFEVGKVPVDDGILIGSQVARINGSDVAEGDLDYAASIGGLNLGDTVEGVFTAEYARHVEYGTTSEDGETIMPGRFFVRTALQKWQANVDASAAKFKD